MWNNMVELKRLRNTIWRMRLTCWIPKAANTQSEYVILIAFPPQQCLKKRALMLCYTYIASLIDSLFSFTLLLRVLRQTYPQISSWPAYSKLLVDENSSR